MRFFLFSFLNLMFFVGVFASNKYEVSVCAIFNNETPYLKEWIEYHRLIGVDHFYLYNNNSSDKPLNALVYYIKNKFVTLVDWPDYFGKLGEEKPFTWILGTKAAAFQHAIKLKNKETKWLVLLDINEFILPVLGESLKDTVRKYDQYGGIILKSDFFDASSRKSFGEKKLVIQSDELILPPNQKIERIVEKMIFKPSLCQQFSWPPFRCVLRPEEKVIEISTSEVRVNSYMNRTKNYSISSKRGKIDLDPKIVSEKDKHLMLDAGYDVREHSMERYVPELMKKMGYTDSFTR